jgi:chaperonin GroES
MSGRGIATQSKIALGGIARRRGRELTAVKASAGRPHHNALLSDHIRRTQRGLVAWPQPDGRRFMKFRPLHDRVAVTRIDAEEKTPGGIIIPDTAREKPQEGRVVAVGPGGRDETGKLVPPDVKVGDRVLFGKWSGTEVRIDGVEYLIMKEGDILGVLNESQAKRRAA